MVAASFIENLNNYGKKKRMKHKDLGLFFVGKFANSAFITCTF